MFINKYNLKFGCDPEVFATYNTPTPEGIGFSNLIPFAISPAAFSKFHSFNAPVGGDTKHPIYYQDNDGKIIGDGVAFEINLSKPYEEPIEMYYAVRSKLDYLEEMVFETDTGFRVNVIPTVNFEYAKWWKPELVEDKFLYWSTIFGCDPDTDAFNTELSCSILDVSQHPFRYGGGHIHISGDSDIDKNPIPFVKLLALTVGNYTVIKAGKPILEEMRAKYYGKAGKHRIQTYSDGTTGVEYRTPSNAWLNYELSDFEYIFDLINYAVYLLKNPKEGIKLLDEYAIPTIEAISKVDQKQADQILSAIGA